MRCACKTRLPWFRRSRWEKRSWRCQCGRRWGRVLEHNHFGSQWVWERQNGTY